MEIVSATPPQNILPELLQPALGAVLHGEPLFDMPKDLYIPPDALEVIVEAFSGPLDLLLYLIKKNNLNILDIPIAEITRQYMQYVETMQALQLELAAEYLLMAAMLAEIKSRMLLPRPPANAEEQGEDPRAELIRRLQEYERFKKAAEDLDSLPRIDRDIFVAQAIAPEVKLIQALPSIELQELLLAFKNVCERAQLRGHHQIEREVLSVRERMLRVLDAARQQNFIEFGDLFLIQEGRQGVVVTFIAILELIRQALIEWVQAEPFAPIHIRVC